MTDDSVHTACIVAEAFQAGDVSLVLVLQQAERSEIRLPALDEGFPNGAASFLSTGSVRKQ